MAVESWMRMSHSRKDIALSSSYFPESLDFAAGWVMSDLPGVDRAVNGTYGSFGLESLPPSVAGDDADFPFLALLDTPSEAEAGKVAAMAEALQSTHGIILPEFFTKFMSSKPAQRCINSCTACFYDLGESLFVLGDNRGVALRFLRDQQDCCLWYIYFSLSDKTKHCILCSFIGLEYLDEALAVDDMALGDDGREAALYDKLKPYVLRCSPDIVDFTKRFFIENEIWMAGEGFIQASTSAMALYVDHARLVTSKKYRLLLSILALRDLPRMRKSAAPIRMLPKDILRRLHIALPLTL